MSQSARGLTLVTGGTGFIGRHVVGALLASGRRVRLVTRRRELPSVWRNRGIEVVPGDVRDASILRECLDGVEVVYALAGHNEIWARRPALFYETNRDAVSLLMQEASRCRHLRRILYASSSAALGAAPAGEMGTESTRFNFWRTRDDYTISKYLGELEALRAAADGLPVVVLNPTLVVGPGDERPTPIGRFFCSLAAGRIPFAVDSSLNLVDVRDVAEAFLAAEAKGRIGQRYVIGGHNFDTPTLIGMIAGLAERLFGRRVRVRLVPTRLALPAVWCAEKIMAHLLRRTPLATCANLRLSRYNLRYDNTRARHELTWTPRDAEETLVDALRWFAENAMIKGLPAADTRIGAAM